MSYTKYTIPILKQLLKDNNISSTHMNKFEMLQKLLDANILKREDVFPPKATKKRGRPRKSTTNEVKVPMAIDPKHEYLRTIRTQPKKVICENVTTGEVAEYESIYKAAKATGHGTSFFPRNNGSTVGNLHISIFKS